MREWPHPKLAIEMRRKYGDMSFHQMRLMGFHRHHDFVPIDRKTFSLSAASRQAGMWTNAWSRPMLLGFFMASVENVGTSQESVSPARNQGRRDENYEVRAD